MATQSIANEVTNGTASSNLIAGDALGHDRHLALRVHSDGSAGLSVYKTSKRQRLVHLSLDRDALVKLRAAIDHQLGNLAAKEAERLEGVAQDLRARLDATDDRPCPCGEPLPEHSASGDCPEPYRIPRASGHSDVPPLY